MLTKVKNSLKAVRAWLSGVVKSFLPKKGQD